MVDLYPRRDAIRDEKFEFSPDSDTELFNSDNQTEVKKCIFGKLVKKLFREFYSRFLQLGLKFFVLRNYKFLTSISKSASPIRYKKR